MRTRSEIDAEYSIIARLYGDRVFKGQVMQNEIKNLHDKMTELSQEPASHESPISKLEKKNEPLASSENQGPDSK